MKKIFLSLYCCLFVATCLAQNVETSTRTRNEWRTINEKAVKKYLNSEAVNEEWGSTEELLAYYSILATPDLHESYTVFKLGKPREGYHTFTIFVKSGKVILQDAGWACGILFDMYHSLYGEYVYISGKHGPHDVYKLTSKGAILQK